MSLDIGKMKSFRMIDVSFPFPIFPFLHLFIRLHPWDYSGISCSTVNYIGRTRPISESHVAYLGRCISPEMVM